MVMLSDGFILGGGNGILVVIFTSTYAINAYHHWAY